MAAVVLAGGGGARFGGPVAKLLVPFRGRPLASWAIASAVASGLDAVVVVSGAVDLAPLLDELGLDVVVAENPRWPEGQATSLRAGIDACAGLGMEAAVIGLADQPLVPAAAWRAVGRSPVTQGAPILTAVFGGRRRPPVRLHRSVWEMVSNRGDEGARELMRRRPDLVGEVLCDGDPADVDTLEDLQRYDPGSGAADVDGR
ncbi:MAG: nucleotidyltransferase family protein [Acidimicrobiales bacterium]